MRTIAATTLGQLVENDNTKEDEKDGIERHSNDDGERGLQGEV